MKHEDAKIGDRHRWVYGFDKWVEAYLVEIQLETRNTIGIYEPIKYVFKIIDSEGYLYSPGQIIHEYDVTNWNPIIGPFCTICSTRMTLPNDYLCATCAKPS